MEEEYSKPAYESRPNKNSPSPPLLLPSSLKRTILRREYRYQREGRQVRRLLLLRYLLLHPRKRNSSVIAPQIPVNKYFCIGIRLPPFTLPPSFLTSHPLVFDGGGPLSRRGESSRDVHLSAIYLLD